MCGWFRSRDALLDFLVGKSGVRTDGAIVHEGASGDGFRSVRDWNVRSAEASVGSIVADAQLRNLGGGAGDRALVAFTARLGIVERAEAVGELLDLVELGLVGLMCGIVDDAVSFVVKARGGVCGLGG